MFGLESLESNGLVTSCHWLRGQWTNLLQLFLLAVVPRPAFSSFSRDSQDTLFCQCRCCHGGHGGQDGHDGNVVTVHLFTPVRFTSKPANLTNQQGQQARIIYIRFHTKLAVSLHWIKNHNTEAESKTPIVESFGPLQGKIKGFYRWRYQIKVLSFQKYGTSFVRFGPSVYAFGHVGLWHGLPASAASKPTSQQASNRRRLYPTGYFQTAKVNP